MMQIPDICALQVGNIAAQDSILFLWAVHSHLPDALAVIHAWGFTYKTAAFTWAKRTPNDTGYFLGRGYWGPIPMPKSAFWPPRAIIPASTRASPA